MQHPIFLHSHPLITPNLLQFGQDLTIRSPKNAHIPLKKRDCIYPIDQQAHQGKQKPTINKIRPEGCLFWLALLHQMFSLWWFVVRGRKPTSRPSQAYVCRAGVPISACQSTEKSKRRPSPLLSPGNDANSTGSHWGSPNAHSCLGGRQQRNYGS